ncbi:phage head closure protein [Agrobacterium tumefaciens]|uniref:phage head closure protein n=1 Tax=Agrobacterium tumefaciens TaxID=358 RepID=UPI0021CE52E8|nr:phage head closure protein [Agrobacterium tumefaciens]UXT96530.1 phage head closure protein [Agrobacterium tumefaciens]
MRAGKLDTTITIRGVTYVDDGYGGQIEVVADIATARAQIIEQSTDEFIRNYGATTERLRIFRTRWIDGVDLEMKIKHDGLDYDLKQIKPIGRRRGLELRCVRVGA